MWVTFCCLAWVFSTSIDGFLQSDFQFGVGSKLREILLDEEMLPQMMGYSLAVAPSHALRYSRILIEMNGCSMKNGHQVIKTFKITGWGRGRTCRLWFRIGLKTIFNLGTPFREDDDKIPVLTSSPNTNHRQTVLEFAKLRPFKGKGSSSKPYFFQNCSGYFCPRCFFGGRVDHPQLSLMGQVR